MHGDECSYASKPRADDYPNKKLKKLSKHSMRSRS